jgi:hypothetical protein
MADTPETAKTHTITLTDRPPVAITEDAWPVIAHGQSRDWSPHGQNGECDANRKWRCDIRVRRSIGARHLVYGIYEYETKWMGERDRTYKAGVVIEAGHDVVAAIRKIAAAPMNVSVGPTTTLSVTLSTTQSPSCPPSKSELGQAASHGAGIAPALFLLPVRSACIARLSSPLRRMHDLSLWHLTICPGLVPQVRPVEDDTRPPAGRLVDRFPSSRASIKCSPWLGASHSFIAPRSGSLRRLFWC